jgi:hypothetical protein
MERDKFPIEWLRRKTSIEEIEEKKITGTTTREWEAFKSSIKPGDELWEYYATILQEEVEEEIYESGQAGYVILRMGKSIAEYVKFYFD